MGLDIAFWIIAIVCVGAALAVVGFRDIFRAAMSLVLCFLAVAGIYIILSADFLAVVQVLIYVGAVSVLIILAVMLTREVRQGGAFNRFSVPALVVAVLMLGVLGYAALYTPWQVSGTRPAFPTTAAIGQILFNPDGFMILVEVAAVLLLAAILGAIVLLREK